MCSWQEAAGGAVGRVGGSSIYLVEELQVQLAVEGVSERHAEAEAELRCAQAELAQREEQLAEHGAHIEFQTVDRLAQ